jgi:hypothetical protein
LYSVQGTIAYCLSPSGSFGRLQCRGRQVVFIQRVVTSFGDKEFAAIVAYCNRKKLSLYALAKKAIREYIERKP